MIHPVNGAPGDQGQEERRNAVLSRGKEQRDPSVMEKTSEICHDDFHVIPSFVVITVHEEVVDLVVEGISA